MFQPGIGKSSQGLATLLQLGAITKIAVLHCTMTVGLVFCLKCSGNEAPWHRLPLYPSEELEDTRCLTNVSHIPVIGVPVVHDPHLFLTRLAYSIDFPVAHFVIIFYDGDVNVTMQVNHIKQNFDNVTAIARSQKPGVAASWNTIIETFSKADWYLIVAYDVMFLKGQLKKFANYFVRDSVLQGHVTALNGRYCGYNVFAMKQDLIKKIGVFDENIYPAYTEDTEWNIRLTKVAIVPYCYRNIFYLHGLKTDTEYVTGLSRVGVPRFLDSVSLTKNINAGYISRKWGCKSGIWKPEQCVFSTPFNITNVTLGFWLICKRHIQEVRRVMIDGS